MNFTRLACCLIISCVALWFSVPNCLAAEKPTVAIKQAKVAESVSTSTKKYLNLDKLLAEMEASFLATRKFNVVN